jgi:para-aminobenzoate synthetase/4-amino-4-deoxychorismate lyase
MPGHPHPDPEKGVFETMLVVDGRPVELDAHIARLAASLETLFGQEPPEGVHDLVRDRANGISLGRLRLTIAPDRSGSFAVDAEAGEVDPGLVFPSREQAADLRSLAVDGGLGEHKWVDRALLEGAEAGASESTVPLLLDSDGAVLEASRANVFLVRGGTLTTPPTDGRILLGIARRCAIEVAREHGVEVRERAVRLDDLLQADEVFLSGSVRGVEPVRSVDGASLSPTGTLTSRLATTLERRWLGGTTPKRSAAAQKP